MRRVLTRGAWLHATRCMSTRSTPYIQPTSIAELIRRGDEAQLQDRTTSSGTTESTAEQGETVTVNGFIRSKRNNKNVTFLAVGDGSTVESLQAISTKADTRGLSYGSAVSISGTWKPSAIARQKYELVAERVVEQGENDAATCPIQKKYQTPEYLRTVPHVRCRMPFNALMLRLRSAAIASATTFFNKHDYVQAHTPIITSSDCEGAGEVFSVTSRSDRPRGQAGEAEPSDHSRAAPESDKQFRYAHDFFKQSKNLTVSSQLHLEALCQSVSRVWTLSPCFRAERSDTPRHLSEFYMLEAEVAFTEDLNDVMALVEGLIRNITRDLQSSLIGKELLTAKRTGESGFAEDEETPDILSRWQGILTDQSWPRITYTDAVAMLQAAQGDDAPRWGDSLTIDQERIIATQYSINDSPVFVTHYPKSIKPFYMLPSSPSSPTSTTNSHNSSDQSGKRETVACFDLLLPNYGELVGGSLREHRYSQLKQEMARQNLTESKTLQWYLDLRRWGSVPHGGFGLGWDRLLAYLSGVGSIRDVVAWPRWYRRCDG